MDVVFREIVERSQVRDPAVVRGIDAETSVLGAYPDVVQVVGREGADYPSVDIASGGEVGHEPDAPLVVSQQVETSVIGAYPHIVVAVLENGHHVAVAQFVFLMVCNEVRYPAAAVEYVEPLGGAHPYLIGGAGLHTVDSRQAVVEDIPSCCPGVILVKAAGIVLHQHNAVTHIDNAGDDSSCGNLPVIKEWHVDEGSSAVVVSYDIALLSGYPYVVVGGCGDALGRLPGLDVKGFRSFCYHVVLDSGVETGEPYVVVVVGTDGVIDFLAGKVNCA